MRIERTVWWKRIEPLAKWEMRVIVRECLEVEVRLGVEECPLTTTSVGERSPKSWNELLLLGLFDGNLVGEPKAARRESLVDGRRCTWDVSAIVQDFALDFAVSIVQIGAGSLLLCIGKACGRDYLFNTATWLEWSYWRASGP